MGLRLGRVIAGILLIMFVASAQEPRKRSWKKTFLISVLALGAAHALDAHSSMGRLEANPLLRNQHGRFSPGAAAVLKTGATAGIVLLELHLMRRKPDWELEKPAAAINFASAAALGAIAIVNRRRGRPLTVADR